MAEWWERIRTRTKWTPCELGASRNGRRKYSIPTSAGVYAIYEGDKLSYIGSSENLCWRLRTHVNSGRFTEPMMAKVVLTSCSEAARKIERRMLQRLRPPKNHVINVAVKVRRFRCVGNPYDEGV